jgi:hypothetical protein
MSHGPQRAWGGKVTGRDVPDRAQRNLPACAGIWISRNSYTYKDRSCLGIVLDTYDTVQSLSIPAKDLTD